MRARVVVLMVAMTLLAGIASAQSTGDTERKLRELRKELKQIGSERRKLEGQRGEANRAVRDADEAVGRTTRALNETQAAIVREQQALGGLQTQREVLAQSLVGQREVLANLVRASYMTGRDAPLKVMLSQDQIAKANRELAYYGALQRDRAARIREISGRLAQLEAVQTEINQKRTLLAAAREKQQIELAQVAQQRKQRAATLAQVDAKYRDKATREKALGQDAKALERVLAQLRAAAAKAARERAAAEARARREAAANSKPSSKPSSKPGGTSSRPARPTRVATAAPVAVGGAGWPLSGSLLAGFGGTMPDGSASSGMLIGAAAGTPVRAVADGQVVFAEWMSGYGLLCIVDHGNGYMSLYAHNDALMKDVGSNVKRGDAVGSVGNSGGQGRPALYFELRRGGKPVNPTVWLRR
ncbi:murein hydrolase activator EnvC family protein [Solilutibacter tolerans]|uniref:Septal ring factor EnvC, activator of murein hydrolases AmiA and AmiB n=1 Tax=Solilutibacter tolerans TaxID=1604334 RepID=A0A1N6QVT3_9GAMM|nr:peptidoglycan DD-metalloendopeptidase family protein [Lysobacter tolerans]SIQ20703.1 Septal ring factor EnvC, activator of murein hydrolases AmiA and AmiB [Lysobacter tolerans]